MQLLTEKIIENSIVGAVLFVVLWFIWKGGGWVGVHFLIPLRDRVIEHIDRLDEATESMQSCIKAQGQLISDQTKLIENQTSLIHRQAKETDENSETLNRIDVNVTELRERSSRFFAEAHREHTDKYSGDGK